VSQLAGAFPSETNLLDRPVEPQDDQQDEVGRAFRSPMSSLRWQMYRLPTERAESDGTFARSETTVVAAEVRTDGLIGTGWTYASKACVPKIEGRLGHLGCGHRPVGPQGRSWAFHSQISSVGPANRCVLMRVGASLPTTRGEPVSSSTTGSNERGFPPVKSESRNKIRRSTDFFGTVGHVVSGKAGRR
jgi:hypothetical protein